MRNRLGPCCFSKSLRTEDVLHHRRTGGRDAELRTVRRAAAEQARCDREGGELLLPASGVGRRERDCRRTFSGS